MQDHTRIIDLEGVLNFRDLGGYKAADGRLVRKGQIFRSAELSGLTDADLAAVEALGIKAVFDLRSNEERAARPSRPWGDAWGEASYRLLSHDYSHSGANLGAMIRDLADAPDRLYQRMVTLYTSLPWEQAQPFGMALREIAGGHLPLLFHCAAGKDRTGALAALLLTILGVDRETILDDYLLTQHFFERNRKRFLRYGSREGVDDAVWDPVLRVEESYLAAMFTALDAHAGGVNAYFDEIGVNEAAREAIRGHLLEA